MRTTNGNQKKKWPELTLIAVGLALALTTGLLAFGKHGAVGPWLMLILMAGVMGMACYTLGHGRGVGSVGTSQLSSVNNDISPEEQICISPNTIKR